MSKEGTERDVHFTPPSSSSSTGFKNSSTESGSSSSATSTVAQEKLHKRTSPAKDVLPKNRRIIFVSHSSIESTVDDTGSNRRLAGHSYDKWPSYWGQIKYPGKTLPQIELIEAGKAQYDVTPYLPEYLICFGYFGDGEWDTWPIQISDPCRTAIELDKWQEKMFIEEGGHGDKMESPELRAWFSLECVDISQVELPFWILVTDEAPKPCLYKSVVDKHLGTTIEADIPSREIFRQLYAKYKGNVFILLAPYSGWRSDGSILNPTLTDTIRKTWLNCIDPEHHHKILDLHEEKSLVDVQLGIIALTAGARDKTGYTRDLKGKEQSDERIANVWKTLDPYWAVLSGQCPPASEQAKGSKGEKRDSGARRC